jgi:hypothetical protein
VREKRSAEAFFGKKRYLCGKRLLAIKDIEAHT